MEDKKPHTYSLWFTHWPWGFFSSNIFVVEMHCFFESSAIPAVPFEWHEAYTCYITSLTAVSSCVSRSILYGVRYGASGALKPGAPRLNNPPRPTQWPEPGGFFCHPLPLSQSRPLPCSIPGTAPPVNEFSRQGPRFFVYSPGEPSSFDTWMSNCVTIYQKPDTSNAIQEFICMQWFILYEQE